MDVVEAAFQVDRDGAVEFLLLDLQDALGIGSAGIVQQEIDHAPLPCDIGHHLMGARERGDVGLVGERLSAQRLDLARGALHLGLEQVDQRDVVAARRQFEGAAAADAPRAAGDDGRLAHAACSLA